MDPSDTGLGAVLLLEFEGESKLPIAYASRKLVSWEKNYSVIIWVIKKFRKYLFGAECSLETDHKPLSLMQLLNPKIKGWALKLQLYRSRTRGPWATGHSPE